MQTLTSLAPEDLVVVQEYQKLVQVCKELDLDIKQPNTVTRDTLVTLLVHVLVRLVQPQEPELESEED